MPASGMVTALEPILKACGGLWIASGSGDADRETVDENDKVLVPPLEEKYTLRRVWLTKEQEDHFYFHLPQRCGQWRHRRIHRERMEIRVCILCRKKRSQAVEDRHSHAGSRGL